MGIAEKINDDIKQAMLAKDKDKLEALRAIKAALLLVKTGKDVSSGEIPAEVEISLLQKLVKQRTEAAEIYKSQKRQDLADVELFQAGIIRTYLPEQLDEETLTSGIGLIITQLGADGMKDMGKVMGAAAAKFKEKADNKLISEIVKKMLNA